MSASSSSFSLLVRLSPKIALDVFGACEIEKKMFNYDKPFEGSSNILSASILPDTSNRNWLVAFRKKKQQPASARIPNYITRLRLSALFLRKQEQRKNSKASTSTESSTHKTKSDWEEEEGEKVYRENSIKLLDENCHNKFSPIN
jgi:hypothetical protein